MVAFWDSWAQKVQSPPAAMKASRPASASPTLDQAHLTASVGRATKDLDQLLTMLQDEDIRNHLQAGEQAHRLCSRARKLLAILEGSTGGACVMSASSSSADDDDDTVIDEAQTPPQPAADSASISTTELADDESDDDLIVEEVTIDSKANSAPIKGHEEVLEARASDEDSDDDLIIEEVAVDPQFVADLKAGKLPSSLPAPTELATDAVVADDDDSDNDSDLIIEEVTLDPQVLADLKAGKLPAPTTVPADAGDADDNDSDDGLIIEEVTLDPQVIADLKVGKLPAPITVPTDAGDADDDDSDDGLIIEEVTLDPQVIADLKAGKMPAGLVPVAVPTASFAMDDDASDDDLVVEEVTVDPKVIADLRAGRLPAAIAAVTVPIPDEADPPEGTEAPIAKEVTLTKAELDQFIRARDAFANKAKHATLPADAGDDEEEPQVQEIQLSEVNLARPRKLPRPQSQPVVGDGDGTDQSDDEQPLVEEVELSDDEEPVIQDAPLSEARSILIQEGATASAPKSNHKSADSSGDEEPTFEEIPMTPAGLAELRKSIEPIEREFADAPGAKKSKRKKKRRGGKRKGANPAASRPDNGSQTAPATAHEQSDDSSSSDGEQDDLDLELTKHWAPSIHQRLRCNRKAPTPAAPAAFGSARGYVAPISETMVPEPAQQQRGEESDDDVPSHGLVSPTPSEDENQVCSKATTEQVAHQAPSVSRLDSPAPVLPIAGAIPRIAASMLTCDEFETRFGSPGCPVVITGLGALDSQHWDLERFLGLLSHRKMVAARYHGSGFVAQPVLWREQHCQKVLNMPAAKFAEQISDGSASSEDIHVVDSLNGTRAGCELERPFQELQALTGLQVREYCGCVKLFAVAQRVLRVGPPTIRADDERLVGSAWPSGTGERFRTRYSRNYSP